MSPAGSKDARVLDSEAWAGLAGKPASEAIPALRQLAYAGFRKEADWYWRSISSKRRASLWARSLALILLALGSALPIIGGIWASTEIRLTLAQISVACLALAGLSQVADRVFGWSSGWVRYIATVTAMEDLWLAFELGCARRVVAKMDGSIGAEDVAALLDEAVLLEQNVRKIRTDETGKWALEFSSGAALLEATIKSQQAEVERRLVELSAPGTPARAGAAGAVEVVLTHPGPPVPVEIAIDEDTPAPFLGTTWARTGLPPGPHVVLVRAGGVSVQRVAEIKPDAVTQLNVTAPA